MLLTDLAECRRSSAERLRARTCNPCRRSVAPKLFLELLENRSLPSAAPFPIPGGLGPLFPGEPFEHVFLPGPVDAGLPFGEPSAITDFNGFVGAAHVEGTGTGSVGVSALYDVDLRFMQGTYRGDDGNLHFGTFALV